MIGTKTTREIYVAYARKLLQDNPGYWGKYKGRIHNYYVYKLVNGEPVEVMSYKRFRKIIETWFTGAKEYIINGYQLELGKGLGKIGGKRVERNHANKQINWAASREKWAKTGERKGLVYFIDDEWVRVGWTKPQNKMKNLYLYKFSPAEGNKTGKGFKKEFSKANKEDKTLRLKYPYFPFVKQD